MVDFVVRNLGQTAARDVRITTDPTLQTSADEEQPKYALKNSVIMTQGIPMLAPGREIRSSRSPIGSHGGLRSGLA